MIRSRVVSAISFLFLFLLLLGQPVPSLAQESKDSTLTIGISRQIRSVDPHWLGSPASEGSVQGAIYVGLTALSPSGETIPALAESWTNVSDLVWRFKLRKGLKFSDGSVLNADEVVWNLTSILAPTSKSNRGGELRGFIRSVRAEGDSDIVFELKIPTIDLPSRLWNIYFTSKQFAATHNVAIQALGAGPYVLKSLDLENGATLEINPNYYGKRPDFSKVIYKVLANEAARISALQSREVDVSVNLDIQNLDIFKGDKNWNTVAKPGSWSVALLFNEGANKALQDVRVRRALNYAINKDAIAQGILNGSVTSSRGQFLSAPFDDINTALQPYPYDPAKARQLLKEAGFEQGLNLQLDVPAGTYVSGEAVNLAIVDQLKQVGVNVALTITQFPAWAARSHSPKAADLTYRGALGYYNRDLQHIRYYLPTGTGQINILKTEADAWYAEAVAAPSRQQRKELTDKIIRLYHDDAHAVFLFPQPNTFVVKRSLVWTDRPALLLWPQDFSRR